MPKNEGSQGKSGPADPQENAWNSQGLQRREFVKKALIAGGVLGAAGMLGGAFGVAGALADSSGGGAKTDGPSVNWEGWEDPQLNVQDGWNNWTRILNPGNLPIYHDNFGRIKKVKPKSHYVMVVDLRKCVGCQSCAVACKSENNVPVGRYRTFVDVSETGATISDPGGTLITRSGNLENKLKMLNVPKLCNHCDNPPCVVVCPVKATFKRVDGYVLVDPRLCIGCGACINACPYDARFINPVSQTADKCTFCVERVDGKLLPSCVTSCVGRARVFGDLNDPNSDVAKLLAANSFQVRKPELGTVPQVFYIGSEATLSVNDNPEAQTIWYTYAMNTNSTAYQRMVGAVALEVGRVVRSGS